MPIQIKRYGWRRGLPDHRDQMFVPPMMASLPTSVDLRPTCPAVYDQGDLGSCTANAIAGLVQFLFTKEKKTSFTPSRLFIYYQERVLERTVNVDAGAEIRDGMKVVATNGCPHENLWPYDITKFARKPTAPVFADGLLHKVTKYQAIDNSNLIAMKSCLALGLPMVGGFTVYDSFESDDVARTGIVPMPGIHENILGGHAVAIVGYNDTHHWFICRNSWGASWGDHGYFYMPYAFLTSKSYADDFWTASVVN